jgi:hypothetical protein
MTTTVVGDGPEVGIIDTHSVGERVEHAVEVDERASRGAGKARANSIDATATTPQRLLTDPGIRRLLICMAR